jgi:two-component system nitrate/nitrite response regulator NarL
MSKVAFRISIVCADRLLRELLADLLRSRSHEVVSASTAIEKLLLDGPQPEPNLVLVHLRPGDPAQVGRLMLRLRTGMPDARIVILTERGDVEAQLAAVRAEADGTVHMDTNTVALVDSLALVMAGERVYPSLLIDQILHQRLSSEPAVPAAERGGAMHGLTQTERQVLRLLMAGHANKEIARELGLSESTIKMHVRRICRRTGCSNRTQAAMWAQANGLDHSVESTTEPDAVETGRITRLYN